MLLKLERKRISAAYLAVVNFVFFVFVIVGMSITSQLEPIQLTVKVLSIMYYLIICVAHSLQTYKPSRYYGKVLVAVLIVTIIQALINLLMLTVQREETIITCYRWVAENPLKSPRTPDCPSAVTYTVYLSMAVYLVFLAVNIANYKFWIEGSANNLAGTKNTVIQKFMSKFVQKADPDSQIQQQRLFTTQNLQSFMPGNSGRAPSVVSQASANSNVTSIAEKLQKVEPNLDSIRASKRNSMLPMNSLGRRNETPVPARNNRHSMLPLTPVISKKPLPEFVQNQETANKRNSAILPLPNLDTTLERQQKRLSLSQLGNKKMLNRIGKDTNQGAFFKPVMSKLQYGINFKASSDDLKSLSGQSVNSQIQSQNFRPAMNQPKQLASSASSSIMTPNSQNMRSTVQSQAVRPLAPTQQTMRPLNTGVSHNQSSQTQMPVQSQGVRPALSTMQSIRPLNPSIPPNQSMKFVNQNRQPNMGHPAANNARPLLDPIHNFRPTTFAQSQSQHQEHSNQRAPAISTPNQMPNNTTPPVQNIARKPPAQLIAGIDTTSKQVQIGAASNTSTGSKSSLTPSSPSSGSPSPKPTWPLPTPPQARPNVQPKANSPSPLSATCSKQSPPKLDIPTKAPLQPPNLLINKVVETSNPLDSPLGLPDKIRSSPLFNFNLEIMNPPILCLSPSVNVADKPRDLDLGLLEVSDTDSLPTLNRPTGPQNSK